MPIYTQNRCLKIVHFYKDSKGKNAAITANFKRILTVKLARFFQFSFK